MTIETISAADARNNSVLADTFAKIKYVCTQPNQGKCIYVDQELTKVVRAALEAQGYRVKSAQDRGLQGFEVFW